MANKDRPHHEGKRAAKRSLQEKRQAKRDKHPEAPKRRKRRRTRPASAE